MERHSVEARQKEYTLRNEYAQDIFGELSEAEESVYQASDKVLALLPKTSKGRRMAVAVRAMIKAFDKHLELRWKADSIWRDYLSALRACPHCDATVTPEQLLWFSKEELAKEEELRDQRIRDHMMALGYDEHFQQACPDYLSRIG